MNKEVVVIGAGIAGMTVAGFLADKGIPVTLIEKEPDPGGHVKNWDRLFPSRRPGKEVIDFLKNDLDEKITKRFGVTAKSVARTASGFDIILSDNSKLEPSVLVLATGFDLFDATRKEEYGYGIYDNVITSAELELMFQTRQPITTKAGRKPGRVAFIHCVGSRDEKVGNLYCSKVCCVTGVKQAIEIKEALPETEVFSFYMDLRMYDRNFEELYYEAQKKWGVNFIRGRLSECAENPDHTIVIKTEDTLSGKPMKMAVDLVILLVGFSASKANKELISMIGLPTGTDGFIIPADEHLRNNETTIPGIFITGSAKGPASIADTIADARATAGTIENYLKKPSKTFI